MKVLAVLVVLCFALAFGQRPTPPAQPTLYSSNFEGFDQVELPDLSYVSQLHTYSYPTATSNWSFLIIGQGFARLVIPEEPNFQVHGSPGNDWSWPFIDVHTVQNGTDTWAFGPVDPEPLDFGNWSTAAGYGTDIVVITTENIRYNRELTLGFEGTWYAVAPVVFGLDVVGYFAGFFKDPEHPSVLHYGVARALLNISAANPYNPSQDGTRWIFNATEDLVVVYNNSKLTSYNAYYKPLLFHVYNITGGAVNTTYTVLADPGTRSAHLIVGKYDRAAGLQVAASWRPQNVRGSISSIALHWESATIIFGISVVGSGTGEIVFVNLFNMQQLSNITLPTNYSDPKALVVDGDALYVGMNGGGGLLKINITTRHILGFQRLPPYLTRVWAGHHTNNHIYWVTNEQHTKVIRQSKNSFCDNECPFFGFCDGTGKCQCSAGFAMNNGECTWDTIINDREVIKTEKTGEVVLGIFFTFAVIGAAAGWYLVWKAKRAGYTAV